MPAVGPELPPHLAKRKRSIDDDAEGPSSPPHKVQAATAPERRTLGPSLPPSKNPDELEVDDSSDDGHGPSIAATKSINAPRPAVGPSMPTRAVAGPAMPPSKNPDELEVDDSSDDDYGPSVPKSTTVSIPPKRVLGPAPPPASLAEMPSHPPDSSSDSDSDYGPSLPPAPGSAAETAYLNQRADEALAEKIAASQPAKPQRDEWMLVPPSDSDWSTRVDPTKLKNRKFASGKGAKAPAEKSGISAIWTETPEEKRKRVEDQVLGRVEATSQQKGKGGGNGESRQDEETSRRIREYNEKNRGQSLREKRVKEGGVKEEEDDPSKRAFDREKDMALGGRVGHVAKRDMLAKAADFGTRFQKGSYL
ncbi:GPALPP motifs-containing protein 1 [Lachnellula cervina]|uniref:GPALPP motifs-containing protein 1 n=1 Tax=Lachnellula cervina TaxID=1316786 RepID=A0A7D8UQT4_9HELO|nr:GPALPP motifs-containing protein 1 [Lachnellula cervina]